MDINNNHTFDSCPCCGANQIIEQGFLPINRNIEFSTIEITLKNRPYLVRCQKCRSGFIQNSLQQSDAEYLYTTGDGTKRWTGIDFIKDKTNEVIRLATELVKPDTNLCDVGCNTGEFLSFAKSLGARTYGVELSKQSVRICEKNGHNVGPNLQDFKIQFDIITAFDLIEHLYNPMEFVESVSAKLKKGGFFLILTGNINSIPSSMTKQFWWYLNYPEHVIFPSKKFYDELKHFQLFKYMKTYASKYHENDGKHLTNLFLLRSKDYTGRPSFFSDHHLVVLKKT